jgi:phosphoglycerate dehydrogenase-like enzyme
VGRTHDLRCRDLAELAACSDVITLHPPLTGQTRHLIDDAFLSRVRPGAVLVNCSRAGLIDTDAVLAALTAGRLSGVGLDVLDGREPSAVANPGWRTGRPADSKEIAV